MDIDNYRIFIETANKGSITAAARSLQYSQPGVSHVISAMEEECGFPLFRRSKAGVELTEQGKMLYNLCQKVLQDNEAVHSAIGQFSGAVTGTLHIGTYISVQMSCLPDIIRRMHSQHEKLEFRIHAYDPNAESNYFKNEWIDVGIGMSDIPAGCDFIPLFDDPSVAILPKGHPLTEKETVTADDLLRYDLMIQEDRSAPELKAVFGSRFSSLSGTITFNHDPFMIRMVELGMGIGVTSKTLITPDSNVEIRTFDPPACRTLGLIIPKWKPETLAVRSFIETACELYQEDKYR